jgi:hypothetical protein
VRMDYKGRCGLRGANQRQPPGALLPQPHLPEAGLAEAGGKGGAGGQPELVCHHPAAVLAGTTCASLQELCRQHKAAGALWAGRGGGGGMGGLVCENGSCSNTTQVRPAPAKTCTAGCKTATSAPPCLTRVEKILAGDVSHGQHWFQLKAVFLSRQRVAAVACGRGKGCV